MELRWKVEHWDEYADHGQEIHHTEEPKLQFRVMEGPFGEQWEGEWQDVPTEYVEV